jgi:desulfoferrodoxin-like iron-binding protein
LYALRAGERVRGIRRFSMAVERVGEKYRCNVCGNEVIVTKVGGGELVCCGEPMEKIEG